MHLASPEPEGENTTLQLLNATLQLLNVPFIRAQARFALANASAAQRQGYARVLSALRAGHHQMMFIALGGSVLRGNGCSEPWPNLAVGLNCSYPNRFALWLQRRYGARRLRYSNRALGGTTTLASLAQIPTLLGLEHGVAQLLPLLKGDGSSGSVASRQDAVAPADFLLIDFSVNDRTEPAARIAAATEVLLRFLLTERPSMAILIFEGSCHTVTTRDAHAAVARHYGVPFLAYADVLPRSTGCSKKHWTIVGRGSHPHYSTHQLLANVLAVWWDTVGSSIQALSSRTELRQHEEQRWLSPSLIYNLSDRRDRSHDDVNKYEHRPTLTPYPLRQPFTDEQQRKNMGICRTNLAVYDALHYDADSHRFTASKLPHVRTSRGNWSVLEDRPGKPGWISDGAVGSSIGFDLTFGPSPRALIVFEQGYEGFGDARVSMGAHPTSQELRGVRGDGVRVTQAQLVTVRDSMLRPNSKETLWVTKVSPAPARVKLRYVSSC